MTTLPSPHPADLRVRQLIDDGYIMNHNGYLLLTDKGWRTLCGAAERPFTPRKQSKDEVLHELNQMITSWS